MKIANDIRWLGSGPRAGIGELVLPENEPGSSIMPGKVNPTQCEAMTMVATQVFGNDTAIKFAGLAGELRAERLQAGDGPQPAAFRGDSSPTSAGRSASSASRVSSRTASGSRSSCTFADARDGAHAPIGYDKAAEIAKKAHHEGTTLKEAALALGYLSEAEYDEIVVPEQIDLSVDDVRHGQDSESQPSPERRTLLWKTMRAA